MMHAYRYEVSTLDLAEMSDLVDDIFWTGSAYLELDQVEELVRELTAAWLRCWPDTVPHVDVFCEVDSLPTAKEGDVP